jgi:hypothetical protein
MLRREFRHALPNQRAPRMDLRYLQEKADILIADDYADAYEKAQSQKDEGEKSAEPAKQAEAGKP